MENTTGQSAVMTVKDWVITMIITMIPLVGIIMLFVWAFGSGHNPNKTNWSKAALLVTLIVIAIYIIFFIVFIGMMSTAMR